MNWEDTPEEAAFREEVRAFVPERFPAGYRPDPAAEHSLEPEDVWGYNWPADRHSADPARRERRPRLGRRAGRAWLDRAALAGRVRRRRAVRDAGVHPARGDDAGAGADGERHRRVPARPDAAGARHRGAEGRAPAADRARRADLGAGLLRARRRARTWPRCARSAVRDGDHYVVDGQKVWTSLGVQADWLFVLVRTDPDAPQKHQGITFLLVDTATPGVTVRPITDIRGDVPFAEMFFDDVRGSRWRTGWARRTGAGTSRWTR